MLFEDLNLIPPLLDAVKSQGYTEPTPIQQGAIPVVLERKDLLGTAQTGTGKTAAYAIPILQLLQSEQAVPNRSRTIKALILAPTRELAIQIKESFEAYGRFLKLRIAAIYGGVSQVPQTNALKSGVDILIATPGRLLDLMNQRLVRLNSVEFFVLDEADRMLDMGFIHDVNKIIAKLPEKRQTMLFSATMPPEIMSLASSILNSPEEISVAPVTATVDTVEQKIYFVDKCNKKSLLVHLLKTNDIDSALVFSRTKYGANKIVEILARAGIKAEAIHGNKSQSARQLALNNFKSRKTRVLVATDIAARGIDVVELSHVINYDLPNEPETYIHRIGRTGRAGLSGIAISFCDEEEADYLKSIQRLIGFKIPVVTEHPFPATVREPAPINKSPNSLSPKNLRSFGYGHRSGHRNFGKR